MNTLIAVQLIIILCVIPCPVFASQDIQGKVVKVKDGDTIVISPVDKEQYITCRLYGIDAPETAKRDEPGQPYGEEATKELKHLILAKHVQVITTEKDRYNRDICFITLDGLDVNLEMVKHFSNFVLAGSNEKIPPRPPFRHSNLPSVCAVQIISSTHNKLQSVITNDPPPAGALLTSPSQLRMGVDLAFGLDVTAIYIQFGSAWMRP